MMEKAENVVVSGRVRLARNYQDLPFSCTEQPYLQSLRIAAALLDSASADHLCWQTSNLSASYFLFL